MIYRIDNISIIHSMLTLVTCWYNVKAKFPSETYQTWISNFIMNVNKFNLVIFTDEKSKKDIEPYIINEGRICLKIVTLEDFYGYKYKDNWIKNHSTNNSLNGNQGWKIDWELNMIWSEKINFVKRASEENYFNTEWYGWCDIGYFRGRKDIDLNPGLIPCWPNEDKIASLDKNKIYYNMIGNSDMINKVSGYITNLNEYNLPVVPIPPEQISISGGFFLISKVNINWWWKIYYDRLELYFKHNYLVKDDQIIVIDSIFHNKDKFNIIHKQDGSMDSKWFYFSFYLL